MPCPLPGDLPRPEIKPIAPALAGRFSTTGSPAKSCCCCCFSVASVVSNSSRPHGLQPTRLLRPWDFPGKTVSQSGVYSGRDSGQQEWVMPSSYLILCRPLLLLPRIPPSIRVFSNKSTLHMRCPKYWNFSFSIIPSKEIPGLISFRMDWLDLLAVQGTLKSLL